MLFNNTIFCDFFIIFSTKISLIVLPFIVLNGSNDACPKMFMIPYISVFFCQIGSIILPNNSTTLLIVSVVSVSNTIFVLDGSVEKSPFI